jgi:hypothetical protein
MATYLDPTVNCGDIHSTGTDVGGKMKETITIDKKIAKNWVKFVSEQNAEFMPTHDFKLFEEIMKQLPSLLEIFFQSSPAYLLACKNRHN